MYVNVDIDPWEILEEVTDDELMQEVNARGLTVDANSFANELADAIQLEDQRKVNELLKQFIHDRTGRIV